jgi:hypothetical protein
MSAGFALTTMPGFARKAKVASFGPLFLPPTQSAADKLVDIALIFAKRSNMNSSKINEWLTLTANVAVVGGIVFLAIEISQNNELLRSESRQSLVANDVASLSANFQNADVFAKFVSEGEMTAEDQLRLSFMFALDLRNREFEYFQYVNGLLDEQTWLAYRHVLLINHATGLGRKWWDEVGRGIVDPDFAKLVDELLVDAEPDDTYRRMATWADD